MRKLSLILAAVLLLGMPVCAEDPHGGVVYSWKNSGKQIALTFDDGPHPQQTPEILAILEEYGIRATFFVIGQNAQWYGDCLAMVYEAGHEIGNHSFSHANLTKTGYDGVCQEIEETEHLIGDRVPCRTSLLRPPEGMIGEDVFRAAAERDYTVVCWSVDTRDWAHTPPESIAQNVLSTVEGGDIILFHDYIGGDTPTPTALRMIIPKLLEQGYEFVTVSELIGAGE
ncbi:MAG: polysaccharide deacetylase family protein [Clostridia bacterium]|nr:polysaccharide deacetylase family protein [Clostridia bacterium]